MKPWEAYIRKVEPYVPGEQPNISDMVKLNTNENPYPPAPGVKAIVENMKVDNLRLYPDPLCSSLTEVLADFYGLEKNQVFVGVGSDDVLSTAFMTFFNSEKPILFPDITYSFYDVWANVHRIPYELISLDENFRIRKEDYYRENGGIVLANPNAPTSICEPLSFVEDILQHNQDVIVIVDEAYIDFGGESAIKLIDKYENLLVVQTFSKSRSMAGIRIGYCMGNAALIAAINDVKYSINSYTMNMASLLAGVEAVRDKEYFESNIKKIVNTRERAKRELEELGFVMPDSKANFLFATHKSIDCFALFEWLRERHIYVRHFNKERISNHLRITVGTDEEMDRLISAIKEYQSQL